MTVYRLPEIDSVEIEDRMYPIFDFEANKVVLYAWLGEDGQIYPHGLNNERTYVLILDSMNQAFFQILGKCARVVQWFGYDIQHEWFCNIDNARILFRYYQKSGYVPAEDFED